jgi:hypothetical protein
MMMRPLKSVSAASLLCLLLVTPVLISSTNTSHLPAAFTATNILKSEREAVAEEAASIYDSIGLNRFSLSRKAFEYAWVGYKRLLESGRIDRKEVLSICDFSQSSRRKRLYVIDVEERKVLIHTYVAHGRRSGGEYARSFSNNPESHKSSLGFYVTGNTYYGGHGLALTIEGLERGINDKADERKIVVHGSEYVGSNFLRNNKFNGRSFGCPAVPAKDTYKVINTIKEGSCLFIYHPTKNYISKSKILND